MTQAWPSMGRVLSFRVRFAALLCVSAWASAAQSAPGDLVQVNYEVPDGCPSRNDFLSRVSARVSRPWLVPDGALGLVLDVDVLSGTEAWKARLRFRNQEGQTVERSVLAASCDAALDAIALAIALLLDTSTTPQAQSPTNRHHQGSPPLPTPVPSRDTPELGASPRYRSEFGVSAGFVSGLGSGVAFGMGAFTGLITQSTLSRIGVVALDTGFASTTIEGVELRTRLLGVRLEHCPLRLALASGTSLLACLSAESGVLFLEGRSEPLSRVSDKSGRAFWFMVGITPKLRQHWGRLFMEIEPQVFAPVTRRRFEIAVSSDERDLAYRTPALALGAFMTLGVQF